MSQRDGHDSREHGPHVALMCVIMCESRRWGVCLNIQPRVDMLS